MVGSFVPPGDLEKGVMFMRFAMKQIGSISKVFFWEKCPSEVFTFLPQTITVKLAVLKILNNIIFSCYLFVFPWSVLAS